MAVRKAAPAADPLLTIEEVAAWLRKPVRTLHYWRQQKKGPQGARIGTELLYRSSDVEQWIRDQFALDASANDR